MQRTAFLIYGIAGHLLFLVTYAGMAAFFGNFLLPKTVDFPADTGSLAVAALVNVLLILAFGVPHSVMARPGFKERWTRLVPQPIERSTYVFISSLLVLLLMWQWRAMDTIIWDVGGPARWVLWGLFAVGWLLVPAASLMISHFDLFGTRQVWLYFHGREYTAFPFHTPMLYRWMRHPLYVGWFLAFWATPTMTTGHLLLAGGLSAYILVAVLFEERDLLVYFGRQYEDYCRRVPKFFPSIGGFMRPAAKPETAPARDVAVKTDAS